MGYTQPYILVTTAHPARIPHGTSKRHIICFVGTTRGAVRDLEWAFSMEYWNTVLEIVTCDTIISYIYMYMYIYIYVLLLKNL